MHTAGTNLASSPRGNSVMPAPPMGRLAGAIIGACLVGFAAPVVLAQANQGTTDAMVKASLLGVIPTLIAGLGAMFVLRTMSTSTHEGINMGTAVLACTMVRLFGSLAIGLLLFMSLQPDKKTFTHAFLISALIALTLETLILRSWSAMDNRPIAPAGGDSSR
ncbi:MAG TPA: hypothetical protein VK157_02775 [Phycisphaerales bacterium]|nr:hypothetical protein [Phycisphaerales bacterium]